MVAANLTHHQSPSVEKLATTEISFVCACARHERTRNTIIRPASAPAVSLRKDVISYPSRLTARPTQAQHAARAPKDQRENKAPAATMRLLRRASFIGKINPT
jgi:hypothetical protein